ncbi:hypothetical protein SLA2020_151430 [Shorea laevis]
MKVINLSDLSQTDQNLTQNPQNPNLNITHVPNFNRTKSRVPVDLSKNDEDSIGSSISSNTSSASNVMQQNQERLSELSWILAELEANFAKNLITRWTVPGGEPCKDSRTVEIAIPGLDGRDIILWNWLPVKPMSLFFKRSMNVVMPAAWGAITLRSICQGSRGNLVHR